jgi:glycosyltransferase involved in cell wall biosynthesis
LREFAKSAPFAVRIFHNETNLGPINNFGKAISRCQGDWVSLCDQDDFWLPGKLELLGREMAKLETSLGKNTPILIHTDAVVTDGNLKQIGKSLWEYQCSYPEKGHELSKLLNQSLVTGCTMMINRALCTKALPLPEKMLMMHDWWFALVASAFGRISSLPEPTIRYRQHGANDTGAKKWGILKAFQSLFDFKNRDYVLKKDKEISKRIRNQALAFLTRYNGDLSDWQKCAISAFIDLPNRSYLERKYLIIKYGLYYQGFIRNLGNLILK